MAGSPVVYAPGPLHCIEPGGESHPANRKCLLSRCKKHCLANGGCTGVGRGHILPPPRGQARSRTNSSIPPPSPPAISSPAPQPSSPLMAPAQSPPRLPPPAPAFQVLSFTANMEERRPLPARSIQSPSDAPVAPVLRTAAASPATSQRVTLVRTDDIHSNPRHATHLAPMFVEKNAREQKTAAQKRDQAQLVARCQRADQERIYLHVWAEVRVLLFCDGTI